MPDAAYLATAVAVAAAITWTLRALPFALLAPLRASLVVPYLAASMPVGVMAILVVHTLRHTALTVPPYGATVGLALAATVALHLWRRNVVLSIQSEDVGSFTSYRGFVKVDRVLRPGDRVCAEGFWGSRTSTR